MTRILTSRLYARVRRRIPKTWTIDAVRRARPISKWREDDGTRSLRYDLGRIRYFMDRIERRSRVEPVWVQTRWGKPKLWDGRHRLAAHLFAGKERIAVRFGGPRALLKWLSGEGEQP
jgi:hypothetical protein